MENKSEKLRIIVGGFIGLYSAGGAALDYLQYPLGFLLLGHDVYYIEDTGQYPLFQQVDADWNDPTSNIAFLKNVMEKYGLKDRWAYRDTVTGRSYGMDEKKINDICKTADVFVNISCSTVMRDEYLKIPHRVLVDSDPMFTQVQYSKELEGSSELKSRNTRNLIETHNHLFTFGENIYGADCRIPLFGLNWKITRQPVCLQLWQNEHIKPGRAFTTVMNWAGEKKLTFDSDQWGQKDVEFEKFKNIPAHLPETSFDVVINASRNAQEKLNELTEIGWNILKPSDTVSTDSDYIRFIHESLGEFSVAKETYVKSNSGWFSCRSACYLAAGKPVITQETGWSEYIPAGEGLLSFDDMPSAIEAISRVNSDIDFHSEKASTVAREYFDSNLVLTKFINQLN